MFDEEYYTAQFKDHVATFTDYGNIKILDFKKPDSCYYRIRFLFEDDYCKLHISGDLGDVTASNHNMKYEQFFTAYVNSPGYFREKVDTHSRPFFVYDHSEAVADLTRHAQNSRWIDVVDDDEAYEEALEDLIDDVLIDFDDDRGISQEGYNALSDYDYNCWEYASDIGKVATDFVELYLLAFKLAWEQLHTSSAKEDSKDVKQD